MCTRPFVCTLYFKKQYEANNSLFNANFNNISLEIDFEDTLKEIDPNMTENIQPRILLVDNIYIKDHVDNDTHGREEHNTVAQLGPNHLLL